MQGLPIDVGCDMLGSKAINMPAMKQRLDMAVARAEKQLVEAKEARLLLDRNPDLERLLDLLQRFNF